MRNDSVQRYKVRQFLKISYHFVIERRSYYAVLKIVKKELFQRIKAIPSLRRNSYRRTVRRASMGHNININGCSTIGIVFRINVIIFRINMHIIFGVHYMFEMRRRTSTM